MNKYYIFPVLLQVEIKTHWGGTPSRDGHDGTSGGFGSLGGDSDGGGVGVPVEAGADLPQGDVVLVGVAVPISGVDLGDSVGGSRVGVLQGTGNDVVVWRRVAIIKLFTGVTYWYKIIFSRFNHEFYRY